MSNLVSVADLKSAADQVERDMELMEQLGFPTIRNRRLPSLIRRAAVELEVLKAECWRLSQGT
jgi:hypothetical protein